MASQAKIQYEPSAMDAAAINNAAAWPRRAATAADMRRARATPKSDIESRIPRPKTAMRTRSVESGDAARSPPNGASIVSARRLLMANAAPRIVGKWECDAGAG